MVYLDACLVIYWVEGHSIFAPCIERRALHAAPTPLAISPLVMTEALVMPYRQNHTALIRKYEAFFANSLILPMPEVVFIEAARLRAAHASLKTPDALHLATAQHQGCTKFWTNDDRLQRVVGSYAVNICSRSI
ncbi:MAG: type II toxin-antitoxin system VapC family toxin [Pseudomonadota bacterium]